MVDVVDLALAVAKFHQRLDAGDDVVPVERALGVRLAEVEAHVHLDPAHGREVIAFPVEEQRVEERRGRFDGRRLARAHHPVDVHERRVAVPVLVRGHGVADVGPDVHVVDVKDRDRGDPVVQQHLQRAARHLAVTIERLGDLVPGLHIDRAGGLVDDVLRDIAADDMVEGHQKFGHLAVVDPLLDHPRRGLVARLADDLASGRVHEVVGRPRAAHTLGEEPGHPALVLDQLELDGVVVGIHDAFLIHAERVEERRDREFPPTVDPGKDDVLGVELDVEPGTAVGDDAGGEQELARGVGLALVVVEEHAGRAVHLGNDHPLGSVHDERAVRRHERHVAHVDVLFLDVLHRAGAGILVDIEHDQA